jgi:endonuclease/exonuclease/phosphatase family metal-dependent hydrolase
LADCYLTPLIGAALPDSHPGACAVADVRDAHDRVLFTAISLYGQWEDLPNGQSYSCARVHRMLSDLTGVFASKRTPVVLAGDLNTTTQGSASTANLAAPVFGRLEAWGLVDCVWHTRASRPQLVGCTCTTPQTCSHVRTYKHNRRDDSEPTQWDYAFASESLVHGLQCRVADERTAWTLSDHCPIVLDLSM